MTAGKFSQTRQQEAKLREAINTEYNSPNGIILDFGNSVFCNLMSLLICFRQFSVSNLCPALPIPLFIQFFDNMTYYMAKSIVFVLTIVN
jgi:hypothetical protein